MVFTCTGSTFTAMSLDYSTADQLTGTITAASAWDEYTKGTLHINFAGKKYDDKFTLCDVITNDSVACGSPGAVELDLSEIAASHFGQNFSTLSLTTFITTAYIEFSAMPDGTTTEQCTKNMFVSGYDKTSTGNTSSQLNATAPGSQINYGLMYGTIALAVVVVGVGLAAYAMKRAKMSLGPVIKVNRMRSRSRSSRSGRSLSSRSRSMPKNDAEEKLVDEEGEVGEVGVVV